MEKKKRRKLESAGWRIGSSAEFLELTNAESALIEMKLNLGLLVQSTRKHARLSQQSLADRIQSSQSRIAKLESGDGSVSLDLIVKAAFAAGAKRADLAKAISRTA